MKRIYRYMGWLALPVALAACQDDNGLSPVNAADGLYVLSASMPQQAQGRVFFDPAENPGEEVLYWNEKDQFQLYQPTADGSISEANIFTISEGYQENERLRSADFTGQHEVRIGSSYYAFYPSALLNEEECFELNMGEARIQVDDMAAYEEYLRTHLFMKAKGIVKENTVLHFEPLYATVKIHYTNHTDEVQSIKRLGIDNRNGRALWGIKKTFITRFDDEWNNHVAGTRGVEFVTTPVEVLPNASQDFYMVFFPNDSFVPGGEIVVSIQTVKQYSLITLSGLDVMEISRQNGGASSFEAGKVYQFNVSQTNRGLEWDRDMGKELIINDKMLSAIENNAQVKFIRLTSGAIDVEANSNVINSITQLDLSGLGLTSLEGIEYFTSLESLQCEANSLDRLDVSALTNLKTLKCGAQQLPWDSTRGKGLAVVLSEQQKQKWTDSWKAENGYGVFVEGLDILSAEMVTLLKSAGMNLQTNEDSTADCGINKDELFNCTYLFLSGKPITTWNEFAYLGNLKELHCSQCGLEKIDVSFLPKLQNLGLSNNSLETLDVSKNTELVSLYAMGMKLTSVDLSQNTKLERLNLQMNQLTSINLSSNQNLKNMYLSDNQLEVLDVSQNKLLEVLFVNNNRLTQLDVSKLENMKNLHVDSNQLSVLDVSSLSVLEDLYCGNQYKDVDRKENQILNLTIADWMIQKWNDSWVSQNRNVQVKGLDSSNEDGTEEENAPADNE